MRKKKRKGDIQKWDFPDNESFAKVLQGQMIKMPM